MSCCSSSDPYQNCKAPRERDQVLPFLGPKLQAPEAPVCGHWGTAVTACGLICFLGTCVHRVVDGIEDGCGSDQPKFSFRMGQPGPECSSSPSPGPGTEDPL